MAGRIGTVARKDSPLWHELLHGKDAAHADLEVRVVVGVTEGAGDYPDGATVAEVAQWNHDGTSWIPARPFLSRPLSADDPEVQKMMARISAAIFAGKPADPILNAAGQWAVNRCRRAIDARAYEPNAERTVQRKGSDLPLVDTGVLRSAITYEVRRG
jgi:hypothetical protein